MPWDRVEMGGMCKVMGGSLTYTYINSSSKISDITPYRAHHSFKLHLQPEWTHHQCYVLWSPGLFLTTLISVWWVGSSPSVRPVGWSGDGGGVRETMRVELTSGGGAFPAWGMGERCKLPHRGLGRKPQQLCNFYNVEVTKHCIIA